MQNHVQLTIHNMSEWLELRRRHNHQTVLLLGSRAGALYRSISFYNYCQQYTPHNLQIHPAAWSFRECYKVLTQKQLGERELHALLLDIFKHTENLLRIYSGDGYFAEIVRRGYFREIVSTNIDDLAERAFIHAGLSENIDFEVLIPRKRPITPERELPYRLTKVFGDCLSREYVVYDRQAYMTGYDELNQYLRGILSGHVLAIGVDPLWDSAILPILADAPASLWFVNGQEDIIYDQQIVPVLDQARSAIAVGQNYGYAEFWWSLYRQLYIESELRVKAMQEWHSFSIGEAARSQKSLEAPPLAEASAEPVRSLAAQNEKKMCRVMYIYCDDDLELMEQLWRHLQVLRSKGLITEWHRGLLEPGELLIKQERELRRSQLILVGFSPSFLSSEYYDQAIQALKLSHGGTVTLVPVLLRAVSSWKQTPFGTILPLPREGRVLAEMTLRERDRALSRIADDIDKLVQHLPVSEDNS